MPAFSPKVGVRYLTPTGAPVQVLEVQENVIVLQGLASDNRLRVPGGYPLQPFDPEKAVSEARPSPYNPRARQTESVAPVKPIAPLIDAMLLAGNKTMRGILRELRRKASAACHGRDLEANVRARVYWLKKKGRVVMRDKDGRLSVK